MKHALAFVAALMLVGSAVAQHKHGDKGPNGGPMEDVAGVHAELMVSGNTLTINVFDEDSKPVPTKGFSGAALIVAGADNREPVAVGPKRLEGRGEEAYCRRRCNHAHPENVRWEVRASQVQ